MFQRATNGGSGGNSKAVEGDLIYPTAGAVQTITVDGITNIESVIVYYPPNMSVQCSAIKENGSTYANGYHVNPSADTIVDINGNTFTFKWQSSTTFRYRAYGT